MGHIQWDARPELKAPVVIAAFEGWNDAGDAATFAARFLRDTWRLRPCGEIDPEDYYDFTTNRPEVRVTDGDTRAIDWPQNRFFAGSVPDGPDVLLLQGVEPALKWRTFCQEIIDTAHDVDASLVITLGALLSDVPHTQPVPLVGTAYDSEVIDRLGLERSSYEGPTGIVGVLHSGCLGAGLASASLWAAVPTYVPGATSPKAALALVERLADLIAIPVDTTELEIATASYERQVTELVESDEELGEFVQRLEEDYRQQAALPTGDELIRQVERYLQDRDGHD
jgi:proteasome assembly chaperone (PAC2) family protein